VPVPVPLPVAMPVPVATMVCLCVCGRPNVVQAVRSVRDQAIPSDLTWRQKSETPKEADEEAGPAEDCADYYSNKTGRLPPWIYNQ
jgi:hypothetical protein